ncbi:MAG: glycosyl hydrolase [Saprospiraceae bacterium]|nr:glycosyl hydrolase [Saprospiraceae bacterium]
MKFQLLFTLFFFLSLQIIAQDRFDEKYYKAMEWRSIGPFRGGRSCAVTGVEKREKEFYMGTTGGGIWKTTDAGAHWKNISDGFFGGSIGAIEVAAADPNVILVGEGEETVRGNVSSGHGIWKSEDGGKSWIKSGLENTKHIVRIRTHPKNADVILVAALGNIYKPTKDRGIYKSKDGGKTWLQVLFVNDSTGAIDLIYDVINPRIVFATTWNVQRNPYKLSSGGPGSAIWKSTDGGDTWKNISQNKGLPEGVWGKSTVVVCPSNHDRIYAMIENESGGLFRSDDGGMNWILVNGNRELRQRAWYFSRLCVDPSNDNIIYVLNVSLHKSMDGGKNFVHVNTQHGDHHDMWINPEQPQWIIVANDGGGQISDDHGKHWSPQSNQPTAQFYRITTDNHYPFRIYAAQQDNSTIRIAHRTAGHSIGIQDWEPTAGGESGHIAVDPLNQEIVYGGSYGGYLTRYDHSRKISRSVNVWPDNPIGHGAEKLKYRFQWNFPIFFSPHNPKKMYCASNHLHVTENEGQTWKTISPDLTRNDTNKLKASGGPITKDNTSVEYYCTLFAAAESPRVKDLLWVGSDDGLIHLSKNGGTTWVNITPSNLPTWTMINCIEPDPFLDGGCYITATSYKNGDFSPYLFKTEDYGKTWKKITNGIPSNHFTRVLRADPNHKDLLYAGTEYGMYISFDDGARWRSFQLNLPLVPITDLVIKDNFLIAATQGRSIWMIDDLSPLRQLYTISLNEQNFIFTPKPAIRMDGGSFDTKTEGVNHANGVTLYFYSDTINPKDTLKLYCIDKNQDTLSIYSNIPVENEQKIELKTGCNRININPRMRPAKDFSGMVLWWSNMNGPKALPGNYQLVLKGKNIEETTQFEIVPDKSYPVSESDITKQYEFIKNIRNRIDEAHRAILQMRDIKTQISDFTARLEKTKKTDTIFKLKIAIDSSFTAIENELYQTKSKSGQDPINFPIKLTNKLAHLTALFEGGSFPPTDQAEEFRKEIDSLILNQLNYCERIKQNELVWFNKMIHELSLDIIKPKIIK